MLSSALPTEDRINSDLLGIPLIAPLNDSETLNVMMSSFSFVMGSSFKTAWLSSHVLLLCNTACQDSAIGVRRKGKLVCASFNLKSLHPTPGRSRGHGLRAHGHAHVRRDRDHRVTPGPCPCLHGCDHCLFRVCPRDRGYERRRACAYERLRGRVCAHVRGRDR